MQILEYKDIRRALITSSHLDQLSNHDLVENRKFQGEGVVPRNHREDR